MEAHLLLRQTRWLVPLAGLLALSVTGCGDGSSDPTAEPEASTSAAGPPSTPPEDVVSAYYAAESDWDCPALVETLSSSERDRGVLCEEDELAAFDGPPMTIEITDTNADGEFAEVTLTELRDFGDAEPDRLEVRVRLVVEDGEWKINEFVYEE